MCHGDCRDAKKERAVYCFPRSFAFPSDHGVAELFLLAAVFIYKILCRRLPMASLSHGLIEVRGITRDIEDIMIFHNGVLIASRCLKVCRPLSPTAGSVVSTLRCGGEVESNLRHADGAAGGLPWVDAFVAIETRTSDLFFSYTIYWTISFYMCPISYELYWQIRNWLLSHYKAV